MRRKARFLWLLILPGAYVACLPAIAAAQPYPARPVRVIVPYSAGGGTDVLVRLLGSKFQEATGQNLVLDNRPAAAGMVATELTASSNPDGYTVLFASASLAINVTAYPHSAVDPRKDLQAVSQVLSSPLVLCVNPAVPAKSVRELVAYSKTRRGGVNGASAGTGALGHLALEMLKQVAGADAVHVPYKGGAMAITALMAGEVELFFASALTSKPHIDSGRVRALAVTTGKPSAIFPELPPMSTIYAGFELDQWYAMFFAAGTPRPVVNKLNAEIVNALRLPDVRAFLAKQGVDPIGGTPDELAAYLRSEVDKYGKLFRASNARMQ